MSAFTWGIVTLPRLGVDPTTLAIIVEYRGS
jgi:hypothetical protein